MLASVLGQDLQQDNDGVLRIVRRVAKDRIISTVDPDARHGHKTAAKGFDGFKGHIAADPDSEIITDTAVTPGNAGDATVAEQLINDLVADSDRGGNGEVFGDCAYGTGSFQQSLDDHGIVSGCKTQPVATPPGGMFSKEHFTINLETDRVMCPNMVTVTIRRNADGSGTAKFGHACQTCPLRSSCTTSRAGRSISIHLHESALAAARARNRDPIWRHRYRTTRPKIERKLGHLMRRRHGARNVRVRGLIKVAADFDMLAAAHNIARLARLGLKSTPAGWAIGITRQQPRIGRSSRSRGHQQPQLGHNTHQRTRQSDMAETTPTRHDRSTPNYRRRSRQTHRHTALASSFRPGG